MFRGTNHTTTDAIIDLIRTLPERQQKAIAKTLAPPKPFKKLGKKTKKKQEILNGIVAGLREIKEAKRTGKQLMNLEDTLNEL